MISVKQFLATGLGTLGKAGYSSNSGQISTYEVEEFGMERIVRIIRKISDQSVR